jgi:DNA-binding FrmR family transcriptional regulator
MAERPGQLDQISEAIGRLNGQIDGIEKYIHDKRHDDANVAQKVDALGTRITRDIAAVEGRIEGRIKAMDDRIIALEVARQQEAGARNLVTWILRSPLIGWVAAAIMFAAVWWKGQFK